MAMVSDTCQSPLWSWFCNLRSTAPAVIVTSILNVRTYGTKRLSNLLNHLQLVSRHLPSKPAISALPVSDFLHCHENCMTPMVLFFDSITFRLSLSGVLQAQTFGLGTLCWSLLLRNKGWSNLTALPLCFWQIQG